MANPNFNPLNKDYQITVPKKTAQELAKLLGIDYSLDSFKKQATDVVDTAYAAARKEYDNASQNYYQTVLQNAAAIMDSIRKANASGVASNQNAGMNWLQELTAALALAQDGGKAATENAQKGYTLADKYAADLAAALQQAISNYNSLGLDLESAAELERQNNINAYIAELGLQGVLEQLKAGGTGGYGIGSGGYSSNGDPYNLDSRPMGKYETIINKDYTDSATKELALAAARVMDARAEGVPVNATDQAIIDSVFDSAASTIDSNGNPVSDDVAKQQAALAQKVLWTNTMDTIAANLNYYWQDQDGTWKRAREKVNNDIIGFKHVPENVTPYNTNNLKINNGVQWSDARAVNQFKTTGGAQGYIPGMPTSDAYKSIGKTTRPADTYKQTTYTAPTDVYKFNQTVVDPYSFKTPNMIAAFKKNNQTYIDPKTGAPLPVNAQVLQDIKDDKAYIDRNTGYVKYRTKTELALRKAAAAKNNAVKVTTVYQNGATKESASNFIPGMPTSALQAQKAQQQLKAQKVQQQIAAQQKILQNAQSTMQAMTERLKQAVQTQAKLKQAAQTQANTPKPILSSLGQAISQAAKAAQNNNAGKVTTIYQNGATPQNSGFIPGMPASVYDKLYKK